MEPKYSFGCSTSKPNGCLLNPEGSRMIFFEECKNSAKLNFKIYTHLFYTNHLGEPGGYKSSEKLNIDIAWEKWHELHKKRVDRSVSQLWIRTPAKKKPLYLHRCKLAPFFLSCYTNTKR